MNPKEPWLAVNLSILLPGLGQLYAGQRLRSFLWLVSFLLLAIVGVYWVFAPAQPLRLGIVLLLLAGLLQLANLFDAYKVARCNNPQAFEHHRLCQKDPWKAFFLSSIFLGIGQIYAGKWMAAIGFWLVFPVLAIVLDHFSPVEKLVGLALAGMYCAYHAYSLLANRRPQRAKAWILPVCLAVLIYDGLIALPGLTVETRYIPAKSMQPTLAMNDRVLVNTRYAVPQRQDVVLFYVPEAAVSSGLSPVDILVKRVVGLPGESIEVRNGKVLVNGQSLVEDYIQTPATYQWGPEKVPNGQYFLLGDNRDQSFDSHVFGFISQDKIFGQAFKIFWPPTHIGPIS
ncbi:MAG: signal peptidase I [Leptolyngbyaceae cyanobacterium]